MASKYEKHTVWKHKGEITLVEGNNAIITLYQKNQQPVYFSIPTSLLPRGLPLEPGRMFEYRGDLSFRLTPTKRVSKREIRELEEETRRRLPREEL